MEKEEELTSERHLTVEQREGISAGLQDAAAGPISMTAAPSDKEAVCYQGEIARVLENAGCEVEIDNSKKKVSVLKIPAGVEMAIKEETVRPIHASRILRAFRRVGVVVATKINASRRKNDTLYITVGPNDAPTLVSPTIPTVAKAPTLVSPTIPTAAKGQWKSLAALFAKRK